MSPYRRKPARCVTKVGILLKMRVSCSSSLQTRVCTSILRSAGCCSSICADLSRFPLHDQPFVFAEEVARRRCWTRHLLRSVSQWDVRWSRRSRCQRRTAFAKMPIVHHHCDTAEETGGCISERFLYGSHSFLPPIM